MITIVVPGHPPSPNQRMHWAQRRRLVSGMRDSVAWQARAARRGTPIPYARVVITLVYPDRRHWHDHPNLGAVCKELIDSLKDGGLIVDDDPAHVLVEFRQEVGDVRRTILEVEPLAVWVTA